MPGDAGRVSAAGVLKFAIALRRACSPVSAPLLLFGLLPFPDPFKRDTAHLSSHDDHIYPPPPPPKNLNDGALRVVVAAVLAVFAAAMFFVPAESAQAQTSNADDGPGLRIIAAPQSVETTITAAPASTLFYVGEWTGDACASAPTGEDDLIGGLSKTCSVPRNTAVSVGVVFAPVRDCSPDNRVANSVSTCGGCDVGHEDEGGDPNTGLCTVVSLAVGILPAGVPATGNIPGTFAEQCAAVGWTYNLVQPNPFVTIEQCIIGDLEIEDGDNFTLTNDGEGSNDDPDPEGDTGGVRGCLLARKPVVVEDDPANGDKGCGTQCGDGEVVRGNACVRGSYDQCAERPSICDAGETCADSTTTVFEAASELCS